MQKPPQNIPLGNPPGGSKPRPSIERHHRIGLGGWLFISACTIVAAILLRAFILQTFKIPSESMLPTLRIGDHLVVNKLVYNKSAPASVRSWFGGPDPARFEIVVFSKFSEYEDSDSTKHYIKRIIGLPGETVEIRDFKAYINGELLDTDRPLLIEPDPEKLELSGRNYGPVLVEPEQYFVLGDNRANSQDSRFFGTISRRDIEGRASIIYWSWDIGNSYKIRWSRIGDWVK